MGLTSLQKLAVTLRKMYLLDCADYFWFLRMSCLYYRSNKKFRNEHKTIPIPPAKIIYDIQGDCDLYGFYAAGQIYANEISNIITAERPKQTLKILDWGCGPARILRHLKSSDGSSWELWGSDYNSQSIAWCQRHFSNIHFMVNGLSPPIPIEDSCFDVIYCNSVFTHLSAAHHQQWIDEIFRLLKPGGFFIGTFHGEAYRNELTCDEQRRFDSGELVIRDKTCEGKKNYTAYHCDRVVYALLSSFSLVKKLCAFKSSRQAVWTAVKM